MEVKTNIIFLDLEWEQQTNCESENDSILEIGAAKLKNETKFMKYIRPDHTLHSKTRKLLYNSRKIEEVGVPFEKALSDFIDYAGNADGIVVWSQSTARKLKLLADRYKCNALKKKTVILQDVLTRLDINEHTISFERALFAMDVKFIPSHKHNAIYDAISLKKLYLALVEKYGQLNPVLKNKLYKNSTSKIYHVASCTYLNKSAQINGECDFFDILQSKPCKKCISKLNKFTYDVTVKDTSNMIRRINRYKNMAVTCQQMYDIADFFGLKITGNLNLAIIDTGASLWKVFCDEAGYVKKLKHENYNSRDISVKTYHEHKSFPKDILSLFEYIFKHDQTKEKLSMSDELVRKQRIKEKKRKKSKARKLIEYDEWDKYYD